MTLPATPETNSPIAAPVAVATPAVSIPTDSKIVSDLSWVTTHLIAIVLAVGFMAGMIVGGVALVEDIISKHDTQAATTQQAKANADAATQSTLIAQLAAEHAADTQRDAQQTALLATLVAKMSQEDAATAKQVTADSTLDAQDAANRLISDTKAGPTDVTVAGDVISMSLPLTRQIVADLDLLPQAQADVSNLQSQLTSQQTRTTDAQNELDQANKIIAADKVDLLAQSKADTAACNVRVDAQSAKDRKTGIWVAIGSFVGGLLVGHKL